MSINIQKEKIVFNEARIATDTAFREDGRVMTYPTATALLDGCPDIIPLGSKVLQRGRLVTYCDGTSTFTPYSSNGEPRYRYLVRSEYGELKEGARSYVVTITFPKALPWRSACRLVRSEIKNLLTKNPKL